MSLDLVLFFFFSDPLYSLSSDRDHARSTFKAHTGTDRIVSSDIYYYYWDLGCLNFAVSIILINFSLFDLNFLCLLHISYCKRTDSLCMLWLVKKLCFVVWANSRVASFIYLASYKDWKKREYLVRCITVYAAILVMIFLWA